MTGAKIRISVSSEALEEIERIAIKRKCKTKAECCRQIIKEMLEDDAKTN